MSSPGIYPIIKYKLPCTFDKPEPCNQIPSGIAFASDSQGNSSDDSSDDEDSDLDRTSMEEYSKAQSLLVSQRVARIMKQCRRFLPYRKRSVC